MVYIYTHASRECFFCCTSSKCFKNHKKSKKQTDLNGKPNKQTRYNKTKQTDKI